MKRLFIGTAGYSYADWVGPVYPEGTKQSAYLSHYARRFAFGELNFSFYTLPVPRTIAAIAAKAPQVHWAIKAHQSMTHSRDAAPESYAQYRDAIQPLVESGQLVCCLLQFPTSFHLTAAHLDYLRFLREQFTNLPLVAEFRQRKWVNEELVLPLLRELAIGWCAVDEPAFASLMPPVAAATGPVGYVRLHGRNAAKWWKNDHPYERYDYLYSAAELQEWLPRIERLMEKCNTVAIALNNHYRGQAVQNAQMLMELLPPVMKQHLVTLDAPPSLFPDAPPA